MSAVQIIVRQAVYTVGVAVFLILPPMTAAAPGAVLTR
ncbi:putative membrane protein [Arthrobacter russicus]|uniref:Membrane protein n=1 Tax=Arthrobacter russicus TaxID=172040 RepID=A0ABU1JDZ5_9MICC|nr:putative membrane protein [Arthrobacter russicus]